VLAAEADVCESGSVDAADVIWLVAAGGKVVALPSTGVAIGSEVEEVETTGSGDVDA
jgi:hypothetical protein